MACNIIQFKALKDLIFETLNGVVLNEKAKQKICLTHKKYFERKSKAQKIDFKKTKALRE